MFSRESFANGSILNYCCVLSVDFDNLVSFHSFPLCSTLIIRHSMNLINFAFGVCSGRIESVFEWLKAFLCYFVMFGYTFFEMIRGLGLK